MKSEIDKQYEGGLLSADDDRRIILGDEMLEILDVAPEAELSKAVLAHLDLSLHDPNDRALFNLRPRN